MEGSKNWNMSHLKKKANLSPIFLPPFYIQNKIEKMKQKSNFEAHNA